MLFSIFKIFLGQFRAAGNSTPGPSEAESRLPPEERFSELIQKTLFQNIVEQAMFLKDCIYQRLRRTLIYGNQGLINNLRAESS